MGVGFGNLIEVPRFIDIDVINETRRPYLGGALLPALFFKRSHFFGKNSFLRKIQNFKSYALSTLRVGRSVTRLTVYWAFPSKGPATFNKKYILN